MLTCWLISQTDLALFIRKCPNAPATAPSYIQFEMGCKVLSDAAEDNIRISHFIVRTLRLFTAVNMDTQTHHPLLTSRSSLSCAAKSTWLSPIFAKVYAMRYGNASNSTDLSPARLRWPSLRLCTLALRACRRPTAAQRVLAVETLGPFHPSTLSHSIPPTTTRAQGPSRLEARRSVASTTSPRAVTLASLRLRLPHSSPAGIPPLLCPRLSSPPPKAYRRSIPLVAGSTLLHRLLHNVGILFIPCICGQPLPAASSRSISPWRFAFFTFWPHIPPQFCEPRERF